MLFFDTCQHYVRRVRIGIQRHRLDPVTSTALRLSQRKRQRFICSWTPKAASKSAPLPASPPTPSPAVRMKTVANPANRMYAPPLRDPLFHCCYVTSSNYLWKESPHLSQKQEPGREFHMYVRGERPRGGARQRHAQWITTICSCMDTGSASSC